MTKMQIKTEISETVASSYSSFHKQTSITSAKKASVGYLPAITDSLTKMNII